MFRAALVGSAVTIGCVLVPIVHFVTAIPAPFIGGYFAGAKAEADGSQAATVGLLMALLLIVPVAIALIILASFAALDVSLLGGIGVAILLYIGVLGWLGATLGGSMTRKQKAAS